MASAIFLGVGISSRLKRRCIFLGETVMFISQVSMEIEYINLPVYEIFEKVKASECCKNLDFISTCLCLWQQEDDFLLSWNKSLELSSLPFKKEERERLLSLGGMIGTSDAAGQRAMLSLYRDYFSFYHDKAVEDYEKYGKLSITLGCALGTGLFIMLM